MPLIWRQSVKVGDLVRYRIERLTGPRRGSLGVIVEIQGLELGFNTTLGAVKVYSGDRYFWWLIRNVEVISAD